MLDPGEFHRRARAATNAGHHVRAATLARTGLARDPDPVTRARLLATLAYAEAELGNLEAADASCLEALAVPDIDTGTTGIVHGQRAVVALRRGRHDDALAWFDVAVRALDGDPVMLGRTLLNRGNLHLAVGAPRRALADFDRAATALARATASGVDATVQGAKARHNAGYAAFLLGDPVRALTDMDSVADYLSALSPTLRGICLQDRAEVLAAAGLQDDAVRDLTEAITLFRRGRARRAEAEASLVLARLSASDDPRGGLRWARRASRLFGAMDADVPQFRAEVVAATCAVAAGTRTPPAFARLTDDLLRHGLTSEAGEVAVARCAHLLRHGRLDEASTVPLPRSTRRNIDPWAASVLARRQVALGRRADALRSLRSTLEAAHSLQSTLGSLELQTSLSHAMADLGSLGLSLAVARADPTLILEWSERTRAASSRVVPVRPPEDPEQAADLADLRALTSLGGDPARIRELRRRIRARAWRTQGSRGTAPTVNLAALQQALAGQDATLISWVVVDHRFQALVVTPSRADCVPLASNEAVTELLPSLAADLDVAATDLPAGLAAAVRASLTDRLAALDDLLVTPLRDSLATRRCVITAPGSLAQVPWTLLPGLAGIPVTVARSATSWAQTAEGEPPRTALFVAGTGLVRAAEEARSCADLWPGAGLLTGEEASIRRVTGAAASADLLHVAAHGYHHRQNPLFSHIDLADGPVFGYEFDRIDPLPAVMILSACDLGNRSRGDDPLGLATALLHMGVRTVVASPAALSDGAAADVMPALHRRLATGIPVWDALAATLAPVDAPGPPLVCYGAGW
ncbi:MAG: CHAT domain-containing protein [Propioniciclava sp.]